MNATIQPPRIQVQAFTPVMDHAKFAELVGVSPSVVKGWVDQGYLKTVRFTFGDKKSKRSLINVLALTQELGGSF